MLEWFETPAFYILVLERPNPCMNLWEFCKMNKGPLPEAVAKKIMLQVMKAARHCCHRKVFHRDIKPENILIDPHTLDVKLIDFGCGDLLKKGHYREYAGTLPVDRNGTQSHEDCSGESCCVRAFCSFSFFTQARRAFGLGSGLLMESIVPNLLPSGVWVLSCITWFLDTCPLKMMRRFMTMN